MVNLKKLFSLVLALILVVSLLPAAALPAQAVETEGYWSDHVSEVAPSIDYDTNTYIYTISTASELAWVAKLINEEPSVSNRMFILSDNIDLSAHFWVPIGASTYFNNTFDGNGYTISNLFIGTESAPSTLANAGLFGYASGAVIEDINLTNVSIYTDSADAIISVGGLVGNGQGCNISGVSVAGVINVSSAEVYSAVGGIVGSSSSDLSNCTTSVNITADVTTDISGLSAGGLVGYSSGGIITSCSADGAVSGAAARYAGGLIGFATGTGTVTDSFAAGSVTTVANDSYVGGLIGDSRYSVENCFALGDVSGYTVGGLIGLGRAGTVKNSFARGNITAAGPAGGLVGMSCYNGLNDIINCYASGDVETSQTSTVNQYVGGLIALFDTDAGTEITYAYWNNDAAQIVAGTERAASAKIGVDRNPDAATSKTENEMTGTAFADLLNANRGDSRSWKSFYGINGGFPYLEGLYFTSPDSEDTCNVTFILDGDDVYKIINVAIEDTIAAPADPIKARYDFVGWYPASDGTGAPFDFDTHITGETTIYAKWEPKPTYTVSYNLNGGAGDPPVDTNEYIEGESVTLNPSEDWIRNNDLFIGWSPNSDGSWPIYDAGSHYTMGDEDIEFYASWIPRYTVTYDLNGGTGPLPVDDNLYEQNSGVTVKSGEGLSKDEAVFIGWTLSRDGSESVYSTGSYNDTYYMGEENVTFYAKWAPVYTVSYSLNGGSGTLPESGRYAQGDYFELPLGDDFENGDLRFGGWTADNVGQIYSPGSYYQMEDADITFYAKWTNYWTDFVDIYDDEPDWDEATGTIIINSAIELAWIAKTVNDGEWDFEGAKLKIADSVDVIDLAAHEWVPIGSDGEWFEGDFDGNFKKIINLNLGTAQNPNDDLYEAGLFGNVYGAYISKVYMEDLAIFSSADNAVLGGLIGYAEDCEITNCSATGTISSDEEGNAIGGLIGYCEDSTVTDCSASVDVTGGCYTYIGGLLGYCSENGIYESYATGNVAGSIVRAGGLIGMSIDSAAYNNYASGDVTGGEESVVGGLIGFSAYTAVSFGYWNSDAVHTLNGETVTDKKGVGECFESGEDGTLSKTSEQMKSDDFAGLLNENRPEELSNSWAIIEAVNNSYPVLAVTVTFDKNGGDTEAEPTSMAAAFGHALCSLPTPPAKSGYSFGGWYTEPECVNRFNLAAPFTSSVTLYAKWNQNDSSGGPSLPVTYLITASGNDGGTVSPAGNTIVTILGGKTYTITPEAGFKISDVLVDGVSVGAVTTYTFSSVTSDHTIEAKFEHDCPAGKFDDVDQSLWYHKGIDFVLSSGLFNGVSDTSFSPNADMTRAMLVTVLWRLENQPGAASVNPFKDVADETWYTDAVAWAAENKITDGYDASSFGPGDPITREQAAVILYRYAAYKGYDLTAANDLTVFDDASDVSSWALPAVKWAVAKGLISGISESRLAPSKNASRAEVAVILMHFMENVMN